MNEKTAALLDHIQHWQRDNFFEFGDADNYHGRFKDVRSAFQDVPSSDADSTPLHSLPLFALLFHRRPKT
jgi:hypothetical protein